MTESKEENYDSICAELDRLSILMLDMMKEYVDCKVLIENYIKTGSLHLAKARYIMGNKSVSSLQLPTEDCDILAHTRVSHSKLKSSSSENLVFEIDRLSLVERADNGISFQEKKPATDCLLKDRNEKVNNVKKTGKEEKEVTNKDCSPSEINDEFTTVSGKTLSMSKDPLKWFGVLIPQNLKYAQTNFSTSLNYVVQCVNLQLEMNSVQSKFARLMKLKKELSPSK